MKRLFVNRKAELSFLERKAAASGFQFVVLYGRRRVGKTELIRELGRRHPVLYYLADKRGTPVNARLMAQAAATHFQDVEPAAQNFDDVFAYIVKRLRGERLVVALDEFSYLVERDDTLPSVFQHIIDEVLQGSNVKLILCGSSMEMMERGVLSTKSPLYGRRTGEWKVEPLRYHDAVRFVPAFSFVDQLRTAMILGGVPAYLNQFDSKYSLEKNVVDQIFTKGEPLYNEVQIILQEELREPATYLRILEALSRGPRKVTDVSRVSGVEAKDLPKYLGVLQKLGYVRRTVPITEVRGRKSLYELTDSYFAFWFNFVQPARNELELSNTASAQARLHRDLDQFLGQQFEHVCEQVLQTMDLPLRPTRAGRWWGHWRQGGRRQDVEIDLMCLDDKKREALFCECKWSDLTESEARRILTTLREKTRAVPWKRTREWFGLVARSIGGKGRLAAEGYLVVDARDIERSLRLLHAS